MAYFKVLLPFLPLVSLLFTISDAYLDFMVGGDGNSWKVPSFPDEFNFWAEHNRFNINDTLSFKYDDDKSDSVMVVTEDGYYKCDTTNPVQHYTGGGNKILLDRSGPFYFISGAQGHCEKGQKLVVVVISPDHGRKPDGATPPAQPEPEPSSAPAAEPGCNGGHGLNGGFVAVGALKGLMLVGVTVLM